MPLPALPFFPRALAWPIAALACLAAAQAPRPAAAQSTMVTLHGGMAARDPAVVLATGGPSTAASPFDDAAAPPAILATPSPALIRTSTRLPFGLGDLVQLRLDADPQPGRGSRPSLQFREDRWRLSGDTVVTWSPALAVARAADGHRFASGLVALTVDRAWSPEAHGFMQLRGERISLAGADAPDLSLAIGLHRARRAGLQVDVSLAHGLTPGAPPFEGRAAVSLKF